MNMRINLQHLNLPSVDSLDAWVETQIFALGRTRQIDEANIRLIRLENGSPAYQVDIHLVTPGPDVFAEGRDHTLRAAFVKVMEQLQETISRRATRRQHNLKGDLSAPAAKGRRIRKS